MRGFSPGRINVRNPAESIAIFRKDDKWLNSVHKLQHCLCHLTAQTKEHTQTRNPFWAITMAIITIKRKNNYWNSEKKINWCYLKRHYVPINVKPQGGLWGEAGHSRGVWPRFVFSVQMPNPGDVIMVKKSTNSPLTVKVKCPEPQAAMIQSLCHGQTSYVKYPAYAPFLPSAPAA